MQIDKVETQLWKHLKDKLLKELLIKNKDKQQVIIEVLILVDKVIPI